MVLTASSFPPIASGAMVDLDELLDDASTDANGRYLRRNREPATKGETTTSLGEDWSSKVELHIKPNSDIPECHPPCPDCGIELATNYNMRRHREDQHGFVYKWLQPDKAFECDSCGIRLGS